VQLVRERLKPPGQRGGGSRQQAPEFVMIRAVFSDEEDTDTALWTTAELEECGSEMCVSLKVKVDTPFARIASVLAERLRLDLPSVQVRVAREIHSQSTLADSVICAWVA
jgi:hypothetical protein